MTVLFLEDYSVGVRRIVECFMKMTSEQFREGFDGDSPHFGDLGEVP